MLAYLKSFWHCRVMPDAEGRFTVRVPKPGEYDFDIHLNVLSPTGESSSGPAIAERTVDQSVTLDTIPVRKGVRDDLHGEVAPAVPRSRVSFVKMALILDLNELRLESSFEERLNSLGALGVHGRICLKGLTATLL